MTAPRIQLLVFRDCPLAGAAKRALDEAVASLKLGSYETVDILDPQTPEDLRKWGSPTILVNGRDVTGAKPGDSVGCRVYAGPSKVPEAQAIIDCIRRSSPT